MPDKDKDAEEVEDTDEATEKTFDEAAVRELREENAKWRVKNRESSQRAEAAEAKLREIEDADKSEADKLREENVRLERALLDRDREMVESSIDADIRVAASKAGVIDVDTVAKLVDRAEIEYQDGKVFGSDKAIKRLLKEKPFLQKPEQETAPPPSPGPSGAPVSSGAPGVSKLDAGIMGMLESAKKT